jgi:hypothetical protein
MSSIPTQYTNLHSSEPLPLYTSRSSTPLAHSFSSQPSYTYDYHPSPPPSNHPSVYIAPDPTSVPPVPVPAGNDAHLIDIKVRLNRQSYSIVLSYPANTPPPDWQLLDDVAAASGVEAWGRPDVYMVMEGDEESVLIHDGATWRRVGWTRAKQMFRQGEKDGLWQSHEFILMTRCACLSLFPLSLPN